MYITRVKICKIIIYLNNEYYNDAYIYDIRCSI